MLKTLLCTALAILSPLALIAASPIPYEETLPELDHARIWRPSGKVRAVAICAHGIQSHKAWFDKLGPQLAAHGVEVWAFNRRGSGQTNPAPGHVAYWKLWTEKFDEAGAAAARLRPNVPIVAVGMSWGATSALAAVGTHPEKWSGVVLINPSLKTHKDHEFFKRSGGALGWIFRPRHVLDIPLIPADYTSDPVTIQQRLEGDPRLMTQCTNRFVQQTAKMKSHALKRLKKLDRPVLALLGEADPLVDNAAVEKLLSKHGPGQMTIEVIPGATHAAVVEKESSILSGRIVSWLQTAPQL